MYRIQLKNFILVFALISLINLFSNSCLFSFALPIPAEGDSTHSDKACSGGLEDPNLPKSSRKQTKAGKIWQNAYDTPITYKIVKTDAMPAKYRDGSNFVLLREVIAKSFGLWAKNSDLRFQEVTDDNIAEIRISFERRNHGDGSNFDGPWGTLAHAFHPNPWYGRLTGKYNDKNVISGDLHFDAEENWYFNEPTDNQPYGLNIFATAVHELGHSIGLGHSSDLTSVMYPTVQGNWDPDTSVLPKSDQITIEKLYGPRRGWFARNWILITMIGSLVGVIVLYLVIDCFTEIIPENDNWMTKRQTRMAKSRANNTEMNTRKPFIPGKPYHQSAPIVPPVKYNYGNAGQKPVAPPKKYNFKNSYADEFD